MTIESGDGRTRDLIQGRQAIDGVVADINEKGEKKNIVCPII